MGGIKLTDFDSFVKAQKAECAKRLLDNDQPVAQFLQQSIDSMSIVDLLCCTLKPAEIPLELPLFYRQVFHAWFTLKLKTETKIEDIVLWNNADILIDRKSVFYKQWYENGIFYLRDIYDCGNRLLTFKELKEKYKIKDNFLNYISRIDAIPSSLRNTKIKCGNISRNPQILGTDICKIDSKKLYGKLIESIQATPSCISSWCDNYQINMSQEQWKSIFLLPKQLTTNTKVLEMQLKIAHKIYATDSFVSNFDDTVTKECKTCNVKNNIIHWFFECSLLKHFLRLFQNWLNLNVNIDMKLECLTMLFGYSNDKMFLANYCILQAKWYIHKTRQKYKEPAQLYFFFICFLQQMKQAVQMEKEIAVNNNTIEKFNGILQALEDVL